MTEEEREDLERLARETRANDDAQPPLTLADLGDITRNSRLNQEVLDHFIDMITRPSPFEEILRNAHETPDEIMQRQAERDPRELNPRVIRVPTHRLTSIPRVGEAVMGAQLITEQIQMQRVTHRSNVTFENLEEVILELRTHGRDAWRSYAYGQLHECGAPRVQVRTLLDRYLVEMDRLERIEQEAVSFALRYAALLIICGRAGVYRDAMIETWESVTFDYITSPIERVHQCNFYGLVRRLHEVTPRPGQGEVVETRTETRVEKKEMKVSEEAPRRLRVRKPK